MKNDYHAKYKSNVRVQSKFFFIYRLLHGYLII